MPPEPGLCDSAGAPGTEFRAKKLSPKLERNASLPQATGSWQGEHRAGGSGHLKQAGLKP